MSDQINPALLRYTVAIADVGSRAAAGARFRATEMASEGAAPSLDGATEWLNSPPLTTPGLRGKVVLIDFWTYTCINWLRTLPYIRAWAGRYGDQGLVVIGAHTPEFAFEHNVENVRRAISDMRVAYPVAIDNHYAIWNAFDNHYWPALYLVDAAGQVRYHHFGEGAYDQTETMIQRLLAEAGVGDATRKLVAVEGQGVEAAADWSDQESPETYLGSARAENFVSAGGAVVGAHHTYTVPARLRRNQWAVAGDWTIGPQSAALNMANGRIVYRFHARDLHLVMGPATPGAAVRFRALIDGHPPGAAHGADIDDQGAGAVTDARLYNLIRQPHPITDRQFEIVFLEAGVEAFAFTFG